MTPQEQDLINALLNRLHQQAQQGAPKDAEAEALIRQAMTAIPDAPYLLVQTVLIQDMALSETHRRIKELEDQIAKPAAAPAAAPSFLGGAGRGSVPAAGPWGAPPPQQQPQAPPPQAAPGPVWTQSGGAAPGYPGQGYPAPGGYPGGYPQPPMAPLAAPGATSGFLRQAATTAAGVAGGALLFQGIQSLFGPHNYGGGFLGGTAMQPGISESVVNNYYGSDQDRNATSPSADQTADTTANDPGFTQADDSNYDTGGDYSDNSGGDFGGGGDDGGGSLDV